MFLSRVPGSRFDKVLTPKIDDSPLYKPFLEIKANIGFRGENQPASHRARQAIRNNKAFPALQQLKNVCGDRVHPERG